MARSDSVFPAHAGMNREFPRGSGVLGGVPRARGDEPTNPAYPWLQWPCSPRTRG